MAIGRGRLALVGLLATVGSLWLAANAGAFVYWANTGKNTIGRANIDGTGANQSFITGATKPEGVAVDGQYVYWTNQNGTIGRAKLDGSDPNESFITGLSTPDGLAVSSQYIYWANDGTNSIGRASLDGTGVNPNFITGASIPTGVAVSDQYLYWGNDDYPSNVSIARANINGTAVNENFIKGAGAVQVAVSSQYIYWAHFQGQSIFRANLNGSGQHVLVMTSGVPSGVAVDSQYLYWDNGFAGSGGTIGRANLGGTGANQSFISGADLPAMIAVDAGTNSIPPPPPPPPPGSCTTKTLPKNDEQLVISGCFSAGAHGTYVSSGDVNVNGIHFVPAAGGKLTVDLSAPELEASGEGVVKVGDVIPIWSWVGQLKVPLKGEVTLLNDVSAKLFGFPISGSLKASFDGGDAQLSGEAEFRLHEISDVEADFSITTDNPSGIAGASIELKGAEEAAGHTDLEKCNPDEEAPSGFRCSNVVSATGSTYSGLVPTNPAIINIGPLAIEDLQLAYDPAASEWSGGGTVELGETFDVPEGIANALPAIGVSVTIGTTPSLSLDGFGFTDSGLDVTIGPASLESLSFNLKSNPFAIGGEVSLRTEGGAAIDGGFDYESGDSGGFKLTVHGTVQLSEVASIGGFLLLQDENDAYRVGLGGSYSKSFGPASAKLGLSGGIAESNGNWVWELDGDGSAGVFGYSIQAHGVLSNAGAGACGEASLPFGISLQVGFKHFWSGETDFQGCDFSGLHTVGQGSALSSAVGRTVRLGGGLRAEEFALVGANAPPAVVLSGPGRQALSTPAVPDQIVAVPGGIELADSSSKTTYLIVVHPRAGVWTIAPASTAAEPPESYEQAAPLAPLGVKVRVHGSGRRRRLTWRFAAQPGISVQFLQVSGTEQSLLNTARGHGTARFRVAPGPGGARQVIAIVSVGGFQREILNVARFRAPAQGLPRVTHARYRQRGGELALTWSRVRGASSYAVTVRLRKGVMMYRLPGGARRVTIAVATKVRGVSLTTTVGGKTGRAISARNSAPPRKRKRGHKRR